MRKDASNKGAAANGSPAFRMTFIEHLNLHFALGAASPAAVAELGR